MERRIRYRVDRPRSSGRITIVDDDRPLIGVTAGPTVLGEAAGATGTLRFTRTRGAASEPLTVPLLIGGAASSGGDYGPLPSRSRSDRTFAK